MNKAHNNIWRNFRFTRFFVSLTTGTLGDWFDIFALQIIFVHEFHASPIVMGFLALFYFLPGILLGPFSGVCADRFSKRNIMIITDVVSACLTVGLFLSSSIFGAFVFLILRSSISSLNNPTQQAYIKQVVPDEHLLKASSYASLVFQMCKMMGPILGAVLLIYFSARSCIAINAVSFVLSAIILITLPRDKPAPIHEEIKIKPSWLDDIKDGGKFIWHHKLIRNIIVIGFVWFMCSMIRNSQLAIFLKEIIPSQPNALGYVLGLDGLGAIIAGLIISRKSDIKNYGAYFILGFFLLGLGILGVATYHVEWPRMIFYLSALILGFGSGINVVVYGYVIKKETASHQMGCVYGIRTAIQNSAMAIGTVMSGFLVVLFGEREVFVGLAVMAFVLAIGSISLLRTPHK